MAKNVGSCPAKEDIGFRKRIIYYDWGKSLSSIYFSFRLNSCEYLPIAS